MQEFDNMEKLFKQLFSFFFFKDSRGLKRFLINTGQMGAE